ncbi:MAG: ribosome small subunit-dependent GTPase A [Oscillospiraceae bacterium]|nr:ribosome small subunit-dependent GTPase A [Oscillospiraceae bacterium]
MSSEKLTGLVTKSIGGLYLTETPVGIFECKARGIFRKRNISPAVGDRVTLDDVNGEKAVISDILERKNYIIRPPLANLDVLIFVVSSCSPKPNYTLIDKFIAISAYKDIENIIVVTKLDLEANSEIADIYSKAGIKIIEVDYSDENSYLKLLDMIKGKICAFTGNTGVGKSTLLNHLDDSLELRTGEISEKLGRGRHTTRHTELYKLKNGAYIADTPGFSTFDTNRYDIIHKDKLELCFAEFQPYLTKCAFPDCAHISEKRCAVREAVDRGEISLSRYKSYCEMYEEAKNIKDWEVSKQ